MHPYSRISAVALSLALSPAAFACSKTSAPVVAALRVSQPLVATVQGDDALVINVGRDGCVRARFPVWHTRAGSHQFSLPADELARLRTELASSGVADFSPEAVRADLGRRARLKAASAEPRAYFSDQEVIEFTIERPAGTGAKSTHAAFVWTGLREQRANHPEQAAVAALEAVRDRLVGLADDRRMKKVEN